MNKIDPEGMLKKFDLPDDWYIDRATEPHTSSIHFFLPDSWWTVVSPDDGVVAAFPTHELAFGYLMMIAFGRGGRRPARQDFGDKMKV